MIRGSAPAGMPSCHVVKAIGPSMDSEEDEGKNENEDEVSNASNCEFRSAADSEEEDKELMIDAVVARKEAYMSDDEAPVNLQEQEEVDASLSQAPDGIFGTPADSETGFYSQLLASVLQNK